jgi:hypothetical protein
VTRAGIVHQNVDRAEGVERDCDRVLDIGSLRDIAAHGNRLVACAGRDRARSLLVDIDDGHPGAFARKGLHYALAEARSPAGHQRNLVLETHVGSSISR